MRTTNEYALEWVQGDNMATVTAPEGSALGNKIMRLAEKYPNEVEVIHSELFHIPAKWIKVNPPKQISDENRSKAKERLKAIRASRN